MEKEFWNSFLTEKSWEILQELRKKYNFILIGGWAIFLLTKQLKSKDIDIIIDIKELEKIKKNEKLGKNDELKKYEFKRDEIDIDIYLEYYSKLAIPVEDVKNYTREIEGFKIPIPELLLILKQKVCKERENSAKGEKDKIDIVSLLLFSEIDFKKYVKILGEYKIDFYFSELKKLLINFKEYGALNLNPREFKIKKSRILKNFKS